MEKKYSDCLNETYELFKSQGVSVLGRSYEEVMTSPTLFEAYVTSLTEGASADSQAEMAQLMINTNSHLLTEGSVAGIAPVSSLSGPVIRKLWPSIALKNAVRCEVAKTPAFMINYTRPYYITADENGNEVRHYVPRDGLLGANNAVNALGGLSGDYLEEVITLTGGIGKSAAEGAIAKGCTVKTASLIKKQPLDADFRLANIVYNDGSEDKTLTLSNVRLGIENNIIYDYKIDDANFGTVIVRPNLITAEVAVAAVSTGYAVKSVKVVAHRSVEYNEVTTSWSFDIAREDIRIGTGVHMNAPLAIEALTDMKALYQIDGTKEAVDLMTQAMALDTDGRLLAFLKDNFLHQPGHDEFAGYPDAAKYLAVFDVKPMAGFAGGPKAWREELKPVFDHLAARIKNQTFLGTGTFNIVANPLDTMLITNIDWTFRGGQQNVDGVSVNYSVGTYYGSAYSYKIVSSEIVPQGVMYLVFIPSEKNQLTYSYWAYSFSSELGYRDPNRAMVPSIMLCKRDAMKSFLPAIAAVKIVGNDANSSYDPFRDVIPTTTGTEATSGGDVAGL